LNERLEKLIGLTQKLENDLNGIHVKIVEHKKVESA